MVKTEFHIKLSCPLFMLLYLCPIKIDKMFEIHVRFGKYTCICYSTKCMEQNVLYALLACNNCKFIYKESIIILTHNPEEIIIQKTCELWPHLPRHIKNKLKRIEILKGPKHKRF